ncbi:MAG: efflux RND transporter periplasmic adaptor subunit [Myxococcaceae bacterium]|nr:MAG: efflux RND transporter periplasmic adaptor subunit [Myxococcaceae bacterium]
MIWLRRGLKVLALLVVLGAVAWFAAQRALGPKVAVVLPARREVVQTVVSSGRVLSPAEVSLGSQLGGLVREVRAREGERVTAGQVLVELDDRELSTQVEQARAGVLVASTRVGQLRTVSARVAGESVRQAQANLRAAETTWERQRTLFRSGAIAAAELESAQRSVDVARSQLQSAQIASAGSSAGGGDARVAVAGRVQAEAALRVAEARLAQSRVVAPGAGVIMTRSVEPGDVVTPGRALLVLLRDGDTELSMTPDERNLADLRLGQRAVASAEAFPDRPFPAEVSYIAPTIDALRGTVEVKLRVPTPPPFLRPSMTVSVEVEVARHPNALSLPPDAVRDAATPSPWVMVVGDDGRTARRPVTLGLRGERVVEVASGLGERERVVPSSVGAAVRVGQRVRLRSAEAAR